jgi:hypothetical protein
MAIDRVTGKRVKQVKTKEEVKKEQKEKALPKFDRTYEEELIRQLFEEDIKKQNPLETVDTIEDVSKTHHQRPGEE